jgi:peptidoglycan/xylan/chitin deacetylase (PgdA/CDA1 family)
MSTHEITGAPPARRIVVFTGDLSFQVRKGIVLVDRAIDNVSWLVLVHSPRRKRLPQLLRSQWLNLRRNGWRRIPELLAQAWRRVVGVKAAARPEPGSPGEEFASAAFESRPNVNVARVDDIHAPESLALVRDFGAQLGLALAAPILRRPLFALPPLGTLNLHKGRLPDYRGMPPAFWELWNGETSVGCSVHWVDDKLDAGAVVARDVVQCEPFSTLEGLQLQLAQIGNELVRAAVTRVLDGTAQAEPQGSIGHTYRKPTLAQFAELERRLAARQPRPDPLVKALFKVVLGKGSHAMWRRGYHLLPPRITVLLYHRVTDAVRDNLTTGIAQFDRHMSWLRKHCRVLSLEQVLDTKVIPRSRQPLVCVTFDDGYRDNHDHAVPILVRHQLPAAFFVATGIVGTDLPFPHDIRRGNGAIPNMNWAQLRSMRQMGFTIGSHTVNHIDCAGEPEAVVWDELTRSRDTLRQELGIQDVTLGYPYGGREHMTPQRLDMVRQAGYAGCLSAYGGVNLHSVDGFDVRRRGIHWGFSDAAFIRQCVGLA